MAHPVNANQSQEITGENGSLPESEYDINCPGIPGHPSYKMNYTSGSCKERLANHTCETGDCPRYKGKPPRKQRGWDGRGKTAGNQKAGPRPCADCGEVSKIRARGLCSTCYYAHSCDGTLHRY